MSLQWRVFPADGQFCIGQSLPSCSTRHGRFTIVKSALLFLAACCLPDYVIARCIEPVTVVPAAMLDLKRAFLNRQGEFVGVFEPVNVHNAPRLAVVMALEGEAG